MPNLSNVLNVPNPICLVNSCLEQVIGYVGRDYLDQYASCTSLYGSPVVSTVTPSTEVVPSFSIAAVSSNAPVSSSQIISSVPSAISSAVVSSSVVPSASSIIPVSSSALLSSSQTFSFVLSGVPSSNAAVSSSVAPSSIPPVSSRVLPASSSAIPSSSSGIASSVPSVAPSSSSPVSSLPPCTDSAEHFSACSCITAVSTVFFTTLPAETSTSTVHETVSTTSISTSTSTLTVVTKTIIVQPVTTTQPVTFSTQTATTTTTTSTSTNWVSPATHTAAIAIAPGYQQAGLNVTLTTTSPLSALLNSPSGPGEKIIFESSGLQPRLASNTNLRLHLQNNSSVRNRFIFVTSGTASAGGHAAVTCWVGVVASGVISCSAPARGWTRIINCGGEIFMASPTYVNVLCSDTTLKLSPWFR